MLEIHVQQVTKRECLKKIKLTSRRPIPLKRGTKPSAEVRVLTCQRCGVSRTGWNLEAAHGEVEKLIGEEKKKSVRVRACVHPENHTYTNSTQINY